MRHLTVDQWSRRESYLHDRDPRAKIIALLIFLVLLATAPVPGRLRFFVFEMVTFALLLIAAIAVSRLPAGALELRAMAVLPFAFTFGLASWLAGDPVRAGVLIAKSYLSALAVLLLVSTTPVPLLLRGLESLGAPRVFVLIVQFLHRYLFVIAEQGQRMRLAAACRRGPARSARLPNFQAAAGAVSMLFARSYSRAQGIHNAMLSRGFSGQFAANAELHPGVPDVVFLTVWLVAVLSVRLACSNR